MKNPIKSLIFHPFLSATYPILALLANNIDETPISSAVRALSISIISMSVIWLLMFWIIKDVAKAALITSLTLIILYTYGHLYTLDTPIRIFGLDILSHRYLIPIYAMFAAIGTWAILIKFKNVLDVTLGLNLVGLALIAFPIYQIGTFQITISRAQQTYNNSYSSISPQTLGSKTLPDIYLLILDMYPRSDFLLEEMNYDNSIFINQLEDQGFYVADCALSNYSFTRFSLTALLNMNYIDTLLPNASIEDTERSLVDPLIRDSLVRQNIEELGYTLVAFQTDFSATTLDNADIYYEIDRELSTITIDQLAPEPDTLEAIEISLSDDPLGSALVNLNLTKFEWLVIQTSAIRIVPDAFFKINDPTRPDDDHLERLRQYHLNNYVLDTLQSVPNEVEGPKFVFFHIVSPHPPIVFDENGLFTEPYAGETAEDWHRAFTSQLSYINKRILLFVEDALSESYEQPIIIIQGDHGPPITAKPGFQRSEVLAAYYFPNQETNLPDNISSVNVFRHIFNSYFGGNYKYLEDQAYTSQWNLTPYAFLPVEEENPNCIK